MSKWRIREREEKKKKKKQTTWKQMQRVPVISSDSIPQQKGFTEKLFKIVKHETEANREKYIYG